MFASVMIVEDEPSVREILCWRLTEEGYQCEAVPNAVEALTKIRNGQACDLVVSDIRMPGLSGIELLKELRQSFPDIAVIMVTAVSDMSTAIETLKMGAYDFITKPFNLDEVLIAVDRALEKRDLILKNREYQMYLEDRVEEQTRQIKNLYLDAIKSLVSALEAKDKYTEGHSRRVTCYAVEISRRLNLAAEQIHKIYLAGLLHDIGKIGVKESILNKPTALDAEEVSQIYHHPDISAKILYPILRDRDVLGYVKHHHEYWDGTGRPDGLKHTSIPIGARIMAVADSFDAITSDRPYRSARPISFAVNEIQRCSGSQFDPDVVTAFLRFVHECFPGIEYLRPVVDSLFPDLQNSSTNLRDLFEQHL